MKIKKISYNDQSSLFEVEINNEKFSISYELYNELNLRSDFEIDIDVYNKLLNESEYQTLKSVAENYINYKSRTKQEVRNKLYKNTNNAIVIDKIIKYYEKLGILNDKRYARDYIDYCINIKKYSINFTKNKLFQKGIKSDISSEYLDKINIENEFENALYIFNKKYKNKKLNNYNEINKVKSYLAYKGFNFDIINKVLGLKKWNFMYIF